MSVRDLQPVEFLAKIIEFHDQGRIQTELMFNCIRKYIAENQNGCHLSNLLHRMDWVPERNIIGRSLEEFQSDISGRTNNEHLCMAILRQDLERRGCRCTYRDNGIGPNGELIVGANNIGRPDYFVNFFRLMDGVQISGYVDAKVSPVGSKGTFKVADLKKVIRNNAYIALFLSAEMINGAMNPNISWAIFGTETCKSLLTMRHFSFAPFGGKICVQIGPRREGKPVPFDSLIEVYMAGVGTEPFTGPTNHFVDFHGI